jgi:hypothetical protein
MLAENTRYAGLYEVRCWYVLCPIIFLRIYLCVDIVVTFVYFSTYASLLLLSEYSILCLFSYSLLPWLFIIVYNENIQTGQCILSV